MISELNQRNVIMLVIASARHYERPNKSERATGFVKNEVLRREAEAMMAAPYQVTPP